MRPKQRLLIIDADPIVYRVGFAAEATTLHVIAENSCGTMVQLAFSPRDGETAHAQLKTWLAANEDFEVIDKTKLVEVEPLQHVKQMVRMQVDSIIREVSEFYKIDKRDLYVHLVISGGKNYRDDLATLKGYKANRDPTHKPAHYEAIRLYLQEEYGAYVTDGIEADDHCSIRAHGAHRVGYSSVVIATIDKDLDQIPGQHYNYMQKVFYDISDDEGELWFWRQLLSGDTTDNIGGACYVGPVSADSFVDEMRLLSNRQRFERVCEIYADRSRRRGCYYAGKNIQDVVIENAQLVYLQRKPGELWQPPDHPRKYLEVKVDD